MRRAALAALILAGLSALASACTYGHQEPLPGAYLPLVFPGEARLGASALMVIDSNQFQIGDQLERYDLHRNRVAIIVEGNDGSAPATMRSVFAIESGRATDDAELRAGSWLMAVLFDLPTGGIFTGAYPQHARLLLEVDGDPVPELEGVIWVTGEGGTPTAMTAAPLLPSELIEDLLEPRTLVRLRAQNAGTPGFDPSWPHIGSISAEVRYDTQCLENPALYTGSEAAGSSAFLGAPVTTSGSQAVVTLTMTQPRGLQLLAAATTDPSRLGQGPILDVAFDRIQDPVNCGGTLDQYVEIRNLRVADYDGIPLLTDSSPADSSEFFYLGYVDPERPQ